VLSADFSTLGLDAAISRVILISLPALVWQETQLFVFAEAVVLSSLSLVSSAFAAAFAVVSGFLWQAKHWSLERPL